MDDEIQLRHHFDMDDAFCARMRAAIAAGLESAPIGVITTPGTKNPRYSNWVTIGGIATFIVATRKEPQAEYALGALVD